MRDSLKSILGTMKRIVLPSSWPRTTDSPFTVCEKCFRLKTSCNNVLQWRHHRSLVWVKINSVRTNEWPIFEFSNFSNGHFSNRWSRFYLQIYVKWSWLDAQRGSWIWLSSSEKKVSRRYRGPLDFKLKLGPFPDWGQSLIADHQNVILIAMEWNGMMLPMWHKWCRFETD